MDIHALFSLKGRVALITGGSRGIGRMIATGFLTQGAKVYISARKAAACDAAAAELSKIGPCFSIPGDVSTVAGAKALAAAIAEREPALDILVNNAGVAWGEPYLQFSEHGWDKVMNTNVRGLFFLTQALHPQLLAGAAKGHPAKVINIASIDGISVNPWQTYSYAASKSGVIHLTRRMAMELAPQNIVMSAIAPGPFASEMNRDARDHADTVAKRVPVRRIGRDEDMAAAAIYLASSAGDFVVGETLVVDGGVTHVRTNIEG